MREKQARERERERREGIELPFLSLSLSLCGHIPWRKGPQGDIRHRPLDICGTRYPKEL